MPIRLAHNCGNCTSLLDGNTCSKHSIKVSSAYACDQFAMKSGLFNGADCQSCARHNESSCSHPEKAAAGMRCSSWAPKAQA